MKIAKFKKITNLPLLQLANTLPKIGYLACMNKTYFYLKIHDGFIRSLYPFINQSNSQLPNYLETPSLGAHISLIYPNENKFIDTTWLGKEFSFELLDFGYAEVINKRYYGLWIVSPKLAAIRQMVGLNPMLNFKGMRIAFHITIATAPLTGS